MGDRLDYLLNTDTRQRWKIIWVTAALIAVLGIICEALGAPIRTSEIMAIIGGVCVLLVQVVSYVHSPLGAHNILRAFPQRRMFLRAMLAASSTSAVAILTGISGSALEAAVLDKRLKLAIGKKNIDAETATSILRFAGENKIVLDRKTVEVVGNRSLHSADLETSWQLYLQVLGYVVLTRSSTPLAMVFDRTFGTPSNLPNAPCSKANSIFITRRFYPSYFEADPNQIRNDTIDRWPTGLLNCALQLDNQTIRSQYLVNMIIQYEGGPVRLTDVRFWGHCHFSMKNTPNGRALGEALLKAVDNVITIDLS